jgi:hypothetical protein
MRKPKGIRMMVKGEGRRAKGDGPSENQQAGSLMVTSGARPGW